MAGKYIFDAGNDKLDVAAGYENVTTWGDKLLSAPLTPSTVKKAKGGSVNNKKYKYESWANDKVERLDANNKDKFKKQKEKIANREPTAEDWRQDNAVWKNHMSKNITEALQDKPTYARYEKATGDWRDKFGGKQSPETVLQQQQEIDKAQNNFKPDYRSHDDFQLIVDTSTTPEEKRELRKFITDKYNAGEKIDPRYRKFINHPPKKPLPETHVFDTGLDEFVNMKEQLDIVDRRNKALLEITRPKPDPDMVRGIGNPYLVNRAIHRGGKKYE